MSTSGFSLSTYYSALLRSASWVKSPPVVKSIASPTSMPNMVASRFTLGGENTSHMSTAHMRVIMSPVGASCFSCNSYLAYV